jgi:hypothetical protein
VIQAYSLAMIDMVASCFSIWFVCVMIQLSLSPQRPLIQTFGTVVLASFLLAMACGSKMNSLAVVGLAGVFAIYLSWSAWRGSNGDRRSDQVVCASLVAARIIAAMICVVSNPTLYVNTVDGILALSYEHRLTADIQERMFGGRLNSIPKRLGAIASLVSLSQIAFVGLSGLVVWNCVRCVRVYPWSIISDQGRVRAFAIVLAWWGVAFALLLAWLPFGWDRYALPLIPPTVLVVGKSIGIFIQFVWSRA